MDLISLTRTKILNAIDSIKPRSGYKTVVVDESGQRLLDLVMEKHVLLDRKCANVMLIDSHRAVENFLDVIYIVEANPYSLECITADYSLNPPRYAQAHVLLLSESTSMMGQLSSRLGGRLDTLKVADFNAYPLESHIFSFGDIYSSDMLYNINTKPNLHYLGQLARRLYDLIAPFGLDPIVRYWKPPSLYHNHDTPSILANLLLDQVKANPAPTVSLHRTQVVIMDRSIDQYAPLLHEFTFQALAYDVLKFEDNTLLGSQAEDGKPQKLDEKSTEWASLRHCHLTYAIEELTKRVSELKEANPHFGNNDTQVKVSDIRNMMAALPDYMKSRDSMTINLQVATDCMDTVNRDDLMQVADLEQAFALGWDSDGNKPNSEHVDKLIEILGRKTLSKDIKLRLLMIYILSRRSGLQESDYTLLAHHARLEPYEIEMLQNLAVWGTPTIKQGVSGPESKIPQFSCENTEEQYLYARVTPGLKNILGQALQNQLDLRMFPVVGDESAVDDAGLTAANSLRNPRQRATWAKTTSSSAAAQKPKIFVFMLGGFTASERRAVYELSASSTRDIYLGGPDDLTPAKYLRFLARQRLNRNQLALPCDIPPKRAPNHLFYADNGALKRTNTLPNSVPVGQGPPSRQQTSVPAPPPKADILQAPEMTREKEKKKHRFFKR